MGELLTAMLTCKEVSRSIASDELGAVDWKRRLAVKFHLLMCRHCRRYARQIQEIGDAAKQVFGGDSPDQEARDRLRDSILDQIPTNQNDKSDTGV